MPDDRSHAPARAGTRSPLRLLLDLPNDSPAKALGVTLLVCLVASVLVAGSAVLLRPKQIANRQAEQWRQISQIMQGVEGSAVDASSLEIRIVDLATGDYTEKIDASAFDQRGLAVDPEMTIEIPPDKDLAQIRSRSKYAMVRLSLSEDVPQLIVLPVYGRGFASTLYGYIGLSGDTETVVGLAFYEHGETPGLGALIDDPAWRGSWAGKKVWDAAGEVGLGVARGPVVPGTPEALYNVDGLTGATWTGQGVTGLLRYWLGPDGFQPYLKKVRRAAR